MKPVVIISNCLLGKECRYDGKSVSDTLSYLVKQGLAIGVCPEQLGGLTTPREPSEIVGNKVLMRNGDDVTDCFTNGAKKVLEIARKNNIHYAILKDNSPSCGSQTIYDGSFSGKLVKGKGITARILEENGITVFNESNGLEWIRKTIEK